MCIKNIRTINGDKVPKIMYKLMQRRGKNMDELTSLMNYQTFKQGVWNKANTKNVPPVSVHDDKHIGHIQVFVLNKSKLHAICWCYDELWEVETNVYDKAIKCKQNMYASLDGERTYETSYLVDEIKPLRCVGIFEYGRLFTDFDKQNGERWI